MCKKLFMNTFAVSSVQIDRLMKKAQSDQNIITKIDKRGMHGNQPQIDNQVKDDIKEFISAFPKYSSHYGREKGYGSSVLMLAPGITKKFVYDEFIKEKSMMSVKNGLKNIGEIIFLSASTKNMSTRATYAITTQYLQKKKAAATQCIVCSRSYESRRNSMLV